MKKIFLLISGLLILLAVPITIYFIGQNQELRSRAAPATTMSLTPSTVTVAPDETFELQATIDTGSNQVLAVEIHLTYDPEKLEAQSITNGVLFPNILASGVIDNGTASITVGAPGPAQPVEGTGTAAIVRFKALSPTDAPITVRYASNTFAGSPGEGATNAIIGTTPATITISGSGTTPTPTDTTEETGTPTPTDSADGTGTPTPTDSADGTGTPTPTAGTGGPISDVTIASPAENESTSDTTPTISGQAPADATITITIYSGETITDVVTADANGNWSYTPSTELTVGPQTIVVAAADPSSGDTYNASTSFVVTGDATTDTTDDIPVSGTTELTYLIAIIGVLMLIAGAVIPVIIL